MPYYRKHHMPVTGNPRQTSKRALCGVLGLLAAHPSGVTCARCRAKMEAAKGHVRTTALPEPSSGAISAATRGD